MMWQAFLSLLRPWTRFQQHGIIRAYSISWVIALTFLRKRLHSPAANAQTIQGG